MVDALLGSPPSGFRPERDWEPYRNELDSDLLVQLIDTLGGIMKEESNGLPVDTDLASSMRGLSHDGYGRCLNCGGQEPLEVLQQMDGYCTSECEREHRETEGTGHGTFG